MPAALNSVLEEVIERIGRNYETIFEQFPPDVDEKIFHDAPYYERARAFKKAADLVASSIMENQNLFHSEMIPASLALYRHAIELNLKHMRTLLENHVSSEYRFNRSHDLQELWSPIEEYLTKVGMRFEDGAFHYRVARAIDEFSKIDVDGQLFRYPDSSSPVAANWLKINFPVLRLSVTEIDLFAFGFHDLISAFENIVSPDEAQTSDDSQC